MKKPLSLARALAIEQHSAGFVLEFDAPRGADVVNGQGQAATLFDAVNIFRQGHPEYEIYEWMNVFVVQPSRRTVCRAALEQHIPPVAIHGTMHGALDELFRSIDPERRIPSTLVGDMPPTPSVIITNPETIKDALNEVARQVPGFVWVVQDYRDRITKNQVCALDYFYQDARVATGWKLPIDIS